MRALNIAATGMQAQQTNVEVISNNIANMNTTGYNRRRAEFTDLLYQNMKRVGSNSSDNNTIVPSGIQLGLGVRTAAVFRDTEAGSLTNTGNTLDLAVQGKGYFQVLLPSGETAYTRAGNFNLNDQGQLVTTDGYLVQPAISIPANTTNVTISKTGQVEATTGSATTPTVIGQLTLANFSNEAGLDAIGDNLFLESGSSGAAVIGNPGDPGYGTLLQGYTEASNVDAVTEISNLIVAQRAYEMNTKVITTADDMLQTTSQLARG